MLNDRCYRTGCATSLGALALAFLVCPAAADETDARAILAAMSDYLTAQQSFAFEFDATLQVITADEQKIDLASSGTAAVERPGKIHATRKGGIVDMELGYDGTTVTLIGHGAGIYAQVPFEGTIESMIDSLRNDHGFVLPATDLLMPDPAKILMEEVTDVKDLGVGVINGQVCDHIALRSDELDLQIWIAQGDAPYPCRYSIAARNVILQPQYTLQIDNWTTDVAQDALSVTIPESAQLVDLGSLTLSSNEIPENYTIGEDK